MNTKRILLGLAAAAVVGLVAGELIALSSFAGDRVVQSVAVSFLGAAVGAFIARRDFVLPALGLWLFEWLVVVYVLYGIAVPTGQASVMAIAQYNLLNILLSALAVVLGALIGQGLGTRMQRRLPAV